jgi:rRNA maturation RNase YbeY
MKIFIQGSLPKSFGLKKSDLKNAATFFAEASSRRVGLVFHEVVVFLGDDAHSDEMHRAVMGIEGATDVITQAYDAIPPEEPGIYGELFVNTDQACRVAAKREGWSKAKELLLYVAHGMDHLSGADDHSEKDYRTMRRRELKWIREWFARKEMK